MSDIQKYQPHDIVTANNAIKLTNKLLAISKSQLIPYRKGNKWGFCTPDKTIVIECIYEEVTLFYEDITAVKLNNKWGFINKQGKIVLPFVYFAVNRLKFSDNLLVVCMSSWGVIDKLGNVIVPFNYNEVFIYKNRIIVELVELYKEMDHMNYYQTKIGLYNKKGELLTPIYFPNPYGCPEYKSYWGLFCRVSNVNLLLVEGGFIDMDGEKKIDTSKYQFCENFYNGLARVKLNDKWGFINTSGEVVIDFLYDYTDKFLGQNTFVRKNEIYSLINIFGQEVIKFNNFTEIQSANEGYFTFTYKGGLGVLNNNGEVIIQSNYSRYFHFVNGHTIASDGNRVGVINTKGVAICDYSKYDTIRILTFSSSFPLFGVMLNGKEGIIDASGKEVLSCIYEHIENSYYCYKPVINSKKGLLDIFGQIVIPCVYDNIIFFDSTILDGFPYKIAKIYNNGKDGYIDFDGTEYWED